MPQSSTARRKRKPAKPHPDFPLFAHTNGQWCKKIRGKLHYFGLWGEPAAAMERWLDQKDDLLAGRPPRVQSDGLTLGALCNEFLTSKLRRVQSGEIVERTFDAYHNLCSRLIDHLGRNRLVDGLTPSDFETFRAKLAERCGPTHLSVEITRARAVMRFAFERELIDKPVRYGDAFDRPSQRVLRAHRNQRGPLMFEADELQRIIDAATSVLRPLILLGINAAYGPSDLAAMPLSAVDLDGGWVDFPRPKTGIARRCPLWPETVEAIEEAYARRPPPADRAAGKLALLRPDGSTWAGGKESRPITARFRRHLRRLGLWRSGRSFYSLRRTHRTISDEIPDAAAKDRIMGHTTPGQGAHYVQRISDSRLIAVTGHVREWLFGTEETE